MSRRKDQLVKSRHYFVCFERDCSDVGRSAGWSYVKSRDTLKELKKHKHCVDAEERIVKVRKKRVNGNTRETNKGMEKSKIDVPRHNPTVRKKRAA